MDYKLPDKTESVVVVQEQSLGHRINKIRGGVFLRLHREHILVNS